MTEEDKISGRYRELPREEPPRHLDDAILAASRRAVHTRPAPLVVPSGRQRWYFPLAAAAIIVLAVAVTMHMQIQQPADEMVSSNTMSGAAFEKQAAPSAPAPETAAPSSRPGLEMRDEPRVQRSRPATAPPETFEKEKRAADGARREQSEPAPRLDLQAPPPSPELQKSLDVAATPPAAAREELARQSAGALFSRVEPAAPQATPAPRASAAKPSPEAQRRRSSPLEGGPRISADAAQSPEQWLQGIADLRRQRWHDDADYQLAEFRKRYPDYRISDAMLRAVERPR